MKVRPFGVALQDRVAGKVVFAVQAASWPGLAVRVKGGLARLRVAGRITVRAVRLLTVIDGRLAWRTVPWSLSVA